MPKYFEGTKNLPPEVIEIEHDTISEKELVRILSKKNGRLGLSVKLPGLPANSLGYLFILETDGVKHTVMDIKNIVHFIDIDTQYLSKVIRHSSGVEFNETIQAAFHKIRNEIGID